MFKNINVLQTNVRDAIKLSTENSDNIVTYTECLK